MRDYSFLQNLWKEKLVKQVTANRTLRYFQASTEDKQLLEHLGLPMLYSVRGWDFLPFTYYHFVLVENKSYYLLGDIGQGILGETFLGLERESGEMFQVSQSEENAFSCLWLNTGLYEYLMCLAYYTKFIDTEYPFPSPEVNKQVQANYQGLINDMTKIDSRAMDRTKFLGDTVCGIQVSGMGDYFYD